MRMNGAARSAGTVRSVAAFLDGDGAAGNTIAHASALLALARSYRQIVPAFLGDASWVANWKKGTLIVHAASGAVASKVRQIEPTLIEGLARRGVDCTAVQVKVSLSGKRGRTAQSGTHKPLSEAARRSLGALGDALPSSPLRSAIEALLARA